MTSHKKKTNSTLSRNMGASVLSAFLTLLILVGDITILILLFVPRKILGIGKSLPKVGKIFQKGLQTFNMYVGKSIDLISYKIEKKARKKPPVKNLYTKKVVYNVLPTIFSKIKFFILGALFVFTFVLVWQGYVFVQSLPNPRLIGKVNFPVSTQIYDRNGKLLYDVYRDQDRTPVNIDELPKHVIDATLSIEDKNFYSHSGISVFGGIVRAMKDTYKTGNLQGGSTITQQLVKTSLLSPERTWERKIREAFLAIWVEQIYTKKEILQMYFNQVPYGGSAYGIEEASKRYFNKHVKELTVSEAAFLAGLTRAPSSYSPYAYPELAVRRRNEVLENMKNVGYIKDAEFKKYVKEPLTIQPSKNFIKAPHFVFYVISELEKKYGLRQVEEGGLRVFTTLDLDLQEKAEQILQEEVAKVANLRVGNGALLITSPKTGEILAMVGSKDYDAQPYGAFNVTTAHRQPGSSIKPILYAFALEKDFTAASVIQDTPVVYNVPGSRPYKPVNYDGRYHGNVPFRQALANSYNIPAVKILESVGVRNFVDFGSAMGISTWSKPDQYGLSLALGGAEVKMLDLAEAYGVLANNGTSVSLNPFISIDDYKGNTYYKMQVSEKKSPLSPQSAYIISDILSDNFARQLSFGIDSDLVVPGYKVSVKTGTTNNKRDNWTIGYNNKYLTAVWVGNNDNTPMNPVLTSGVTGASPIWNRVMTLVLEKNIPVTLDTQPALDIPSPGGLVTKRCFFGRDEYFKEGTQDKATCNQKIYQATPSPSASPAQ